MMVSIYKNYASEGNDVPIQYVFDKIRNGGDFVTTIDKIRDSKDENEQQRLKKTLPGVTFCGRFKHRKSDKLIQSTGLVILDFDEKGVVPEMSEYFYSLFKSPRGGYKALVKIPQVKNDSEFKQYFYAIQKHFPDVDTSGKDISRFCFISYDPELFINEDSTLWTKTIQDDLKPENKGHKSDFKKLSLALQMIDNADIGNRNNTFLKAGKLMGGYIAGGDLNELDVLDVCDRAIFDKDPQDYKANYLTFRRGIEYGKAEPLTVSEVKEINTEVKLGKIEYTIEEADQLDEMYNKGFVKGYSVGWKHFEDYYSVRLGFTTYIYGAPFTGKSKFCFNILINLSVKYGLKHLIYSPETGGKDDIYAMLIQIYAEGDITNTFNNQIPLEKYKEAKTFIGKHFTIVSTDETDTDLTLDELLDYADIIAAKFDTKIDTITIDPWNELLHEEEFKRDLYLNVALKKARVNARKKNRHIFIITHIRDQKPISYDDLGTAIYPFPTPNDIAGGQVWNRKGFMLLGLYRHHVLEGHDNVNISKDKVFGKNDLLVRVQKYKPEGTGKRGEIKFVYHPHRHTYSNEWGVFSERNLDLNKKNDDDYIPF
jgi:hypothetical protein